MVSFVPVHCQFFIRSLFLTLQETSHSSVQTSERKTGLSDTDSLSFAKQIRSLIMQVIKVKNQATTIGKTKYVGALNSYIKTLASLMKEVKEPGFDKQKVSNLLSAIRQRVTQITADLEGSGSTTVTLKAGEAIVPVRKVGD